MEDRSTKGTSFIENSQSDRSLSSKVLITANSDGGQIGVKFTNSVDIWGQEVLLCMFEAFDVKSEKRYYLILNANTLDDHTKIQQGIIASR